MAAKVLKSPFGRHQKCALLWRSVTSVELVTCRATESLWLFSFVRNMRTFFSLSVGLRTSIRRMVEEILSTRLLHNWKHSQSQGPPVHYQLKQTPALLRLQCVVGHFLRTMLAVVGTVLQGTEFDFSLLNCSAAEVTHQILKMQMFSFQLYRRCKCKDIIIRPSTPIVRRTTLPSGKVVECTRCKYAASLALARELSR